MVAYEDLLKAGVHYGHLSRKWNPNMKPYIFMKRNDIHIIDLMKTQRMLDEATRAVQQIARGGRKIMFVGTKKQAKEILEEQARRVDMPFVTERWLGGMLTNFQTVRKSVKKMQNIEKMEMDGTFELIQKRERLTLTRDKAKLSKVLQGIADLNRLPSALFIVDIKKEHLAISEAKRLNIPTIAIVDTNSNPKAVDFPIPGNDDAAASIHLITKTLVDAMEIGLKERSEERDLEEQRAADEAAAVESGDVQASADDSAEA